MIKHRGCRVGGGGGAETAAMSSEEDTEDERAVGAGREVLFAAGEGYRGQSSMGQHVVLRRGIRRSDSTR